MRTGSYALTPNKVEQIPTLGALSPRGGPVQDSVLTPPRDQEWAELMSAFGGESAAGPKKIIISGAPASGRAPLL